MMFDNIYVIDLESDGLLETVSKIHCLSLCTPGNREIISLTTYEGMREFLVTEDMTIVGHNIIRYDIPVVEKILGIKVKCNIIDTLSLSWILDGSRKSHGLESYGDEFGIQKPKIADWSSLSIAEYIVRCEEDVKINTTLWNRQFGYLREIYRNDNKNLIRYLKYLKFKMECVRDQEEIGIRLDVEKAKIHFEELSILKKDKKKELEEAMPRVAIKKTKIYQEAVEDENGNIFQKGDLFFNALNAKPIEKSKITGWKEPNANSHVQIKNWLYSLGWVPEHIQHKRNKKTGEVKQIPQIKSQFEDGEICESIKKLFEKEPKLEVLNGLSVLTHRISIFEGFVNSEKDGRLYPSMSGLTNTLRLQHRVIVNLPRFDRKYGEEVRGCIIADEGGILCGSDLSGIEDSTKRHFIYQYDPEYVERMNIKGYDPHLELAILAKFMTKGNVEWYKWYDEQRLIESWKPSKEEKKRYDDLKAIRYKSKTTNFAATYKVGAPALSRYPGINLGLSEARRVLRAYWTLNKAILEVENSLEIKEIRGQKWLFNPISKFWYSLRADKDKFSTLNQGTAVYIFDKWITNIRKGGIKIPFQYHDEIMFNTTENKKLEVEGIIKKAIDDLNNSLKLNITIGCSVDFGQKYSEIH